jgi:hypothetical protein
VAHIGLGIAAAAAVLACILHIDGKAAKILEQNFGIEAAVTARTRGRNQDLALGTCPPGELLGGLRLELIAI